MHYIIILFTTMLFLGCSSPTAPQPLYHSTKCVDSVYSLKSAKCLNNQEFIENLEPYQVIFIGDHHSSKKEHKMIAKTIRELSEKGYRIHLANEWFTPKDNPVLEEYSNGSIDDKEFIKKIKWQKKRGFKFDLFAPIYHAIIETKGKLYGINLSKRERKLISRVNISAMSKEEVSFFDSLDLDVSAHRDFLAPFFSYCHKAKKDESNEECLRRMYRVQVAWDTKMAQESAKLSKNILKTKKDKLIIFAGAAHVTYGLGINLRFARESNLPFVTIIPQSSNYTTIIHGKADFVYMYKKQRAAKELEKKLIQELNGQNSKK